MARPISSALLEHLVDWQRSPGPIPWGEVFGRSAPLALEIGFGNGSFLVEQGAARPERNHIGMELSWTSAKHLFRRLRHAQVANVRALLGDAESLVRHCFSPNSLCEVCINHPSPWPKARHVERRLLDRRFLRLLAERMQPGARLTVVTDHAEYAAWLAEELQGQELLESCHPGVEAPTPAGRSATKYQLKAMAQGVPIHYFEWRKAGPSVRPGDPERPARLPAGEIQMPTLTLSGDVESEQLFHSFKPVVFRERDAGVEVVVRLESVYRRTDFPRWLIEALVLEDRLRQQFGIDIVLRPSSLLIRPSGIGRPYPTQGVKRAIWCTGRWLQSRCPNLTVQDEYLGLAEPPEPWPPPQSASLS